MGWAESTWVPDYFDYFSRLSVAETFLALFEFGCEIGTKSSASKTDGFRLRLRGRRDCAEPFDGLFDVADLPDPEAGDELFGFGKGRR